MYTGSCFKYLRVEEYLRSKEAFVANVNIKLLFGDGVYWLEDFHPFCRVCVILVELLHYVWAYITETLLQMVSKEYMTETLLQMVSKEFMIETVLQMVSKK